MKDKEELLEVWRLTNVIRYIKESNKIEGLLHEPTSGDLHEWVRFMELDEVSIRDLEKFVMIHTGAENRLRDRTSDNHMIGGRHMTGGPQIIMHLDELLEDVNLHRINPFHAHCAFELLHPFTDGNGRSGRMLWHWHMAKVYPDTYNSRLRIGFLHRFYYQTLQYSDDAVKVVS